MDPDQTAPIATLFVEEASKIIQQATKADDFSVSGTHWLWEVVSMLVNQSPDRINLIKETAMVEVITQDMFDNIPSPRVLNSHFPLSMLPKDIMKHRNKIVFVQRNPKDICVSFYNHHFKALEYGYSGTWENYMPRFLKGLGK